MPAFGFVPGASSSAGSVVPVAPAGAEGFFIVEPGSDGSRVRSEILVAGRAPDVTSMSALVQALSADERFGRVQVQRVSRDPIGHVVDFELALSSDVEGQLP